MTKTKSRQTYAKISPHTKHVFFSVVVTKVVTVLYQNKKINRHSTFGRGESKLIFKSVFSLKTEVSLVLHSCLFIFSLSVRNIGEKKMFSSAPQKG